MSTSRHPLDQLTGSEISAVRAAITQGDYEGKPEGAAAPRFNVITLAEPAKVDLIAFYAGELVSIPRMSQVRETIY